MRINFSWRENLIALFCIIVFFGITAGISWYNAQDVKNITEEITDTPTVSSTTSKYDFSEI